MPKYRQVSVIGNATLTDKSLIEASQSLGRALAEQGYNLVCGGRGGVMLEACRGFKSVQSSGVTIGILPDFRFADANPYVDVAIPSGLDMARNQVVVAGGFAVVAIGGGAGTLSEIALASQLSKPIVLFKGTGGWADRLTLDHLDGRGNARVYHVDSVSGIIALLADLWTNHEPGKQLGIR